MINLETIADDLFNKVRGRFPNVTIGDEEGKVTNVPSQARFFDFEYKEADTVLGKVSISIDEDSLNVMYGDDFVANEDSMTRNKWYDFLRELRQFSKKRMLNFDTRNITKSNLNKRDYNFLATNRTGDQQMAESKMYGTNKTSFQKIGSAKLSIKHTEAINTENATARSQKIGAIYVENAEGERFKYPFKHLSGARAMTRHVAEGGKPYDDFGKHITSLSEELAKLRKFKTYMGRSSVMAESLSEYVEVVKERANFIKKEINNLQKESYYKESINGFETPVFEDVPDDIKENWIDELTIKQFNEELSDVFPYIYKLVSEATTATEVGPEDLEEGPIDWIKDKFNQFMKGRQEDFAQYERDVQLLTTILQHNGYDEMRANRIGNDCLNEPRVCLYNEIRKKGLETGDMDMEVQRIGKELNSGWTTRSGTTDEQAIEDAFEEMMGQFSESNDVCEECGNQSWTTLEMTEEEIEEGERHGNSAIYDKCWKGYSRVPGKTAGEPGSCKKNEDDTDEIVLASEEQKTPLGEFILSYFDYTTGQFPKGETAILTMVEKDYGEHFINPAKQFLEKINNRVSEVMGYKEEEPQLTDNTLDVSQTDLYRLAGI
jgi:hypothetical protein